MKNIRMKRFGMHFSQKTHKYISNWISCATKRHKLLDHVDNIDTIFGHNKLLKDNLADLFYYTLSLDVLK